VHFAVAAALTWTAQSSVATALLVMSLAYSNFLTPQPAFALVLGANLSSAINPFSKAHINLEHLATSSIRI
jgi:Na+/phosphate symporter